MKHRQVRTTLYKTMKGTIMTQKEIVQKRLSLHEELRNHTITMEDYEQSMRALWKLLTKYGRRLDNRAFSFQNYLHYNYTL